MAKFKIRFVINQGRHGAPLGKLGRISEQAEKFLRAISLDCGVQTKAGEWLASEFNNGSVEYDAEFQGSVSPADAEIFEKALAFLADYDPDREGLNGVVKESTALEYAKIGSLIDPDEVVRLGIYPHRGGKLIWRDITYSKAERIKAVVEMPLATYGSLQGIIHSWYKEAANPYFNMRELSSDALVRVEYAPRMYSRVADAVREKNTVVLAAGNCVFDRVSRSIERMKLDKLSETRILSPIEFDNLFGSFPEFEPLEYGEDA